MLSPEAATAGTTLILGVLLGVAITVVVYESCKETSFRRWFQQKLAAGGEQGGEAGVVLPVPESMANPSWARDVVEHPDDEDPYPMDDDGEDQFPRNELRVTGGPWVRPAPTNSVALLDRQAPTWPAGRGPGAHRASERLMSADTCQIGDDRLARALREAGR